MYTVNEGSLIKFKPGFVSNINTRNERFQFENMINSYSDNEILSLTFPEDGSTELLEMKLFLNPIYGNETDLDKISTIRIVEHKLENGIPKTNFSNFYNCTPLTYNINANEIIYTFLFKE